MKDASVNTVIISTPNNTHAVIAIQALNAGKNVICEKPMGITEKQRKSDNLWFYDKTKAGFGASADFGSHKVDTICYLFNTEIEEIIAEMSYTKRNDIHIHIDNNEVFLIKMENGAIGTVNVSWTCYGDEINSMLIFGSEGTMKIQSKKCLKDERK